MQCDGKTKAGIQCKNKAAMCRHHKQGAGLKSLYHKYAPKILLPNDGATKNLKKFLNNTNNETVTRIDVGMKPINSNVKKVLNAVSLGNFGKVQKKLGYDDVIHQYMIVTTRAPNGEFKRYKIEKNHVVESKPIQKDDYNHLVNIPLNNKKLNLSQLIENGSKQNDDYYRYSSDANNCQRFIVNTLRGNDIVPNEKTKDLIAPQNAKELIDSLGVLKGVPQAVTDVANVVENVRQELPLVGGRTIIRARPAYVDPIHVVSERDDPFNNWSRRGYVDPKHVVSEKDDPFYNSGQGVGKKKRKTKTII